MIESMMECWYQGCHIRFTIPDVTRCWLWISRPTVEQDRLGELYKNPIWIANESNNWQNSLAETGCIYLWVLRRLQLLWSCASGVRIQYCQPRCLIRRLHACLIRRLHASGADESDDCHQFHDRRKRTQISKLLCDILTFLFDSVHFLTSE